MANNQNSCNNNSRSLKTNKQKERNGRNFPSRSRSKSATKARETEVREAMNGTNDVSWYVNNDQMLKDVASIPFSRRAGTPFTFQFGNRVNSKLLQGGVASISYMPVIGSSVDGVASPVNIAMKSVYSYVRHANSGSKVYDAPDLMMYLLAMDSAYALWSWCVRLIGTANLYNMQNSHYPTNLAKAMGVASPMLAELQTYLSTFRTKVNQFAIRLNSFAVPTKFSTYIRHMWLNQNVFLDGTDPKAQVYIFNPIGFYYYDESVTPGRLAVAARPTTLEDTIRLMDSLLDKLFSSEDIGVMSGDILKAYGPSNLFALGTIDESYVTQPAYDENILMQIENCTITGEDKALQYTITQNGATGAIIQNGITSEHMKGDHILNFHKSDVTPADVMEATRLVAAADGDNVYTGSEVVAAIDIFYGVADRNLVAHCAGPNFSRDTTTEGLKTIFLASNFKQFPLLYLDLNQGASDTCKDVVAGGNMDNFTMVSVDQVRNLHTAALMGMYGIPYVLTQD